MITALPIRFRGEEAFLIRGSGVYTVVSRSDTPALISALQEAIKTPHQDLSIEEILRNGK